MTDMRGTTVVAASGSPLAASRYRTGSNLLAPTAAVFTGAVCLQVTTGSTPALFVESAIWGGSVGGFSGVEVERPSAVRPNTDSKSRHGSQASDGSG